MMLLYTSASSRRYGSTVKSASNRRSASSNSAQGASTRSAARHLCAGQARPPFHSAQDARDAPRRKYWHLASRPMANVEVGKWGCTSAASVVHASRGRSPSKCAYAMNTRDTQWRGSDREASWRRAGPHTGLRVSGSRWQRSWRCTRATAAVGSVPPPANDTTQPGQTTRTN